jgi:hypothetical protein
MKDIKDYLHLYIGCDVVDEYGGNKVGKLVGITPKHGIILHKTEWKLEFHEFKPILRQLNDMTEEEKVERKRLMNSGTDGVHVVVISVDSFESMRYLLSIGMDLFGLIPEGLAIDSKTLK